MGGWLLGVMSLWYISSITLAREKERIGKTFPKSLFVTLRGVKGL